ncbi:apolipoprotein N-acyltransferase [soil metagenome]
MERRGLTLGLGLLAGLLICASLPPWGWWPLAFAGIALWVHLLAGGSRRQRFALSWFVGVGWFGPSTVWIWGLTPPGYVAGLLLGWGVMVGLIGLGSPDSRWRYATVPAGVVLFEWFHTHAPFGGVPLSMLSMSQARAPMLPLARLGGALLVSGAIAALGVALYVAVAERRWREPVAVVLGVGVLVGLGASASAMVHPVREDGVAQEMRIAAVQGGGPQGTQYSSDEVPLVFERHMAATRTIQGPVDLVVWPENAINIDGPFIDDPWKTQLADEAARLDAPIMVGVVEDDPDDPDQFVNYVVVVNPDGTLGDRYDKERRVPFGEYVPLRPLFEPFAKATLPQRDAVVGVGSATVATPAGPTAVAISWEVFFARRVREGVRGGGEVVLNPTNGSSYWLTQVQSQQIATSAFRAVESGRWLFQVAPTGFSAEIDDDGNVLQRTAISQAKVLYGDVPRLTGTTPAQALGDLPALIGAAVAIGAAVIGTERRRRDDASAPPAEVPVTPDSDGV